MLIEKRSDIKMFCERLEKLRKSHKLTQKQLADELNVSKQTISNWENNNIFPSIETLIKICKFFNVTTDYILNLDDKNTLDVTELPLNVVAHLQQLIKDIIFLNK